MNEVTKFATEIRVVNLKCFAFSFVLCVSFSIWDAKAGTDLRFKCDNVKITTSIRKEGKYFYLRTTPKFGSKIDILQILRESFM